MICAITCTEGRPQLFQQCKKYVLRQSVRPDLWLIKTSTPDYLGELPEWAKVVTGPAMGPFPNLKFAISHVPDGFSILMIEDDDWYGANHVAVLSDFSKQPLNAATSQTRYNVPARRWNSKDPNYGGPGQASVHHSIVREYAECLVRSDGDQIPWRTRDLYPKSPTTSVGIKGVGFGLPGLQGKTTKHNPKSVIVESWISDPSGSKLREWVGDEDADFYLSLC